MEDISSTKKRLVIEIPAEALESEIKSALESIRRQSKLPGYRKGKAPAALIEKRFGKEVEAETIQKMVPKFYGEAVEEAGLKPVGMPDIESEIELKRNEPLELVLTLEVRPEIGELNYAGLKVTEVPVAVTDKDIDKALEGLREKRIVFEPAKVPAEEGDMVVIDYEIAEDGQKYEDQDYRIGSGMLPPAFAEKVTGMSSGEDKEFTVPFPKDFPSPEMAGKDVHFKLKVKEVKKPRLPEVDDDLAKEVGFDDLPALKEHIKAQIGTQKEQTATKLKKAALINGLLDSTEFDAPESLVKAELDRLVEEAKSSGRVEPEEALRDELSDSATRHVRATLLVQTVGEREKIEVKEEEIKARVDTLGAQIGLSPENVMKYYISRDGSLDGLGNEVYEDKIMEFLLDKAEVDQAEVPAKAEDAAPGEEAAKAEEVAKGDEDK